MTVENTLAVLALFGVVVPTTSARFGFKGHAADVSSIDEFYVNEDGDAGKWIWMYEPEDAAMRDADLDAIAVWPNGDACSI